ncbi:hypothetical protein DFH09DRAFT_1341697 [Mycena vulgaris]|nr:hypothetical protein DFH09DRAFT_1341697 [Mycena vulgaris]
MTRTVRTSTSTSSSGGPGRNPFLGLMRARRRRASVSAAELLTSHEADLQSPTAYDDDPGSPPRAYGGTARPRTRSERHFSASTPPSRHILILLRRGIVTRTARRCNCSARRAPWAWLSRWFAHLVESTSVGPRLIPIRICIPRPTPRIPHRLPQNPHADSRSTTQAREGDVDAGPWPTQFHAALYAQAPRIHHSLSQPDSPYISGESTSSHGSGSGTRYLSSTSGSSSNASSNSTSASAASGTQEKVVAAWRHEGLDERRGVGVHTPEGAESPRDDAAADWGNATGIYIGAAPPTNVVNRARRPRAARKAAGKDVGMCLGPSAAAGALRMLVDACPICGLGVSVATDRMYQTEVFAAMHLPRGALPRGVVARAWGALARVCIVVGPLARDGVRARACEAETRAW